MIVRFGVWITSQKRVYCLSNLIQYSIKMQRSKCKNANPKKVETRGFSRCPNPGFGFDKMSGLPGYPGFSKPGFQSLDLT